MGNGIYVGVSGTGTLTLAPSDAGAISFGENDAIYLPNSAGTVAGQVYFNIGAALDSGVATNVPLSFQTPVANAVVAIAIDEDMAIDSYDTLYSGSIVFDLSDTNPNQIIIRSLTL
jgi:hypothetical protein